MGYCGYAGKICNIIWSFFCSCCLAGGFRCCVSQNVGDSAEERPHFILSGPPCSGKGVLGRLMAERLGLVSLSTGDILRESRGATGLDPSISAKMKKGELIPDEVIIRLVKDRLKAPDCQTKGWLLDGFPRTKAQAVAFLKIGLRVDYLISLEAPDDLLYERVSGRYIDPVTGISYHMVTNLPPNEEVEKRLVKRPDDSVETLTNRLSQYWENAAEVEKCFMERLVTVKVEAKQTPEDLYNQTMLRIKQFGGEKNP